MAKSLVKTEPPAISTSDHKDIKVGDVLYGVDVGCSGMPTVVPLKVIWLDLGVNRKVRLRTPEAKEWTWSANAGRDTCRNGQHHLFSSYAKARVTCAEAFDRFIEKAKGLVEYQTERISDQKEELDERKNQLAELVAAKSAMKKSKVPDNPFE